MDDTTTTWTCGGPGCDKPLSWHARRAAHLLATEGPDAEREFEWDHPDASGDDMEPDGQPSPEEQAAMDALEAEGERLTELATERFYENGGHAAMAIQADDDHELELEAQDEGLQAMRAAREANEAAEPCVATVYGTGKPAPCGLPRDTEWVHYNLEDSRAIDHEFEAAGATIATSAGVVIAEQRHVELDR